MVYVCLWLTIFGGGALRAERLAASLHSEEQPYCCAAETKLLDWEAAKTAGGSWVEELVGGITEGNSGYGYKEMQECTKQVVTFWESKWKEANTETNPTNFEVFYKDMDKSIMSVAKDSRYFIHL